jgi:hypothetical protein
MDFLSILKENISDKTLQNLSSFLGEEKNTVESALGLAINSFMAGILKFSQSEEEVKKVIKVLEDGGHTGDILVNIESFTENFEKTQLLVTIGNNIVNHFLGSKTSAIVDKISSITEIKKTSSSSILSFASPIVLGYIGKKLTENNFDASGLNQWFNSSYDSVINSLPPVINNLFLFKKVVSEKGPNKKNKSDKIKNKTNWLEILPWVLLALLAFSTFYYYSFYKSKNDLVPKEIPSITQKEVDLIPEDFLPEPGGPIPLDTPNVAEFPSDDSANIKKTESQNFPDQTQKPVNQEISKNIKKANELNPQTTQTNDVKIASKKVVSPVETQAVNIPAGWQNLSGAVFKSNSAEITSNTLVNSLFDKIKNSNKILKIAPLSGSNKSIAEDRAYALREKLLEKGISEDQIQILGFQNGKSPNGIVYKISN